MNLKLYMYQYQVNGLKIIDFLLSDFPSKCRNNINPNLSKRLKMYKGNTLVDHYHLWHFASDKTYIS